MGPKKSRVQKDFESTKILGLKLFGPKIFGSTIILGSRNFWFQNFLGPKKLWVHKIFAFNKIVSQKNVLLKTKFGTKNLSGKK